MGRTAKYKKIKAFDPYSKQNGGRINYDTVGIWGFGDNGAKPKKRSRTAERLRQEKQQRRLKRQKHLGSSKSINELMGGKSNDGLNRPPSDDEDEFDIEDIQGSIKQEKPETSILEDTNTKKMTLPTVKTSLPEKSLEAHGTIDKKEIKEAEKLLKHDAKGKDSSANKSSIHEGRRENESKRAYKRRVKTETNQIIRQQKMSELNPEKRRKKKEFLNQKKKKKRSKASNSVEFGDDDNDDEVFSNRVVDEVPFGEQAERPPTFKAVPRGARVKESGSGKKTIKTNADIEAEQENLERMRRKVQEQYAIIKAKRKREGDFHL